MHPPATCTDATLRTGPPAGKEGLKADPIDTKFPFSTHWIGRFSDDPTAVGITGLADFDNDGDLDFAAGQRGGPMKWWEYCSPDHWALHVVGSGHNSPGGGNALDVDNDGWVDMIAGDFPNVFDDSPLTTIGDIDGDGDMVFAMCTHFGTRVAWFENTKGDGSIMTMHMLATNKNKLHAVFALDFDDDGDLDIYSGESTGTAWIWEDTDGKGSFKEHAISNTSRGHDARDIDIDCDGDLDIDCDGDLDIVGKPWGEGEPEPRDAIYLKNELVEKGGKPVFDRPKGEVWHPTQTRKYCP